MADKTFKGKITAKGTEIVVLSKANDDDYISLTDIERYKNAEEPNAVVANWLRNRNTVEFLGIWEQLYNPNFKPLEFEGFRKEAGLNAFTLSPMKWVNATDAIRDNLIPPELTPRQRSFVYADEADLLNTALFGMTAAEWRKANPDKDGNMRDHATIEQLLVLANIENVNALYINNDMLQSDRIVELNHISRSQMEALLSNNNVKKLKALETEST